MSCFRCVLCCGAGVSMSVSEMREIERRTRKPSLAMKESVPPRQIGIMQRSSGLWDVAISVDVCELRFWLCRREREGEEGRGRTFEYGRVGCVALEVTALVLFS